MKFAMVSTHGIHKARFKLNCETGDCTSFLSLLNLLNGFHFSFEELRKEDPSYLREFDVVMFDGHPSYIVDIISLARMLKDSNALSMFYPEGSTQLYDNSIRGFHKEYYEAWNACDILSIVEEDKVSYYKNFVSSETLVKFIHVPVTKDMESGAFLLPRHQKKNVVLVYGDNNPNHPLIAMSCARRIGAEVIAVEIGAENIMRIKEILPGMKVYEMPKLSQSQFLRHLAMTKVHFYPTEWIGTAREQIACATVGTPCVGNHDSHTQRRLWPDLGCDIYDVDRMDELARKLYSDEDFYQTQVRRAFDRLSFYGEESVRRRFFEAYEQAYERKRKAKVMV